ncbi:hypothetical protein [Clostridium perfringens]|uniref:hypothetical protein n=1 Tax=Clostridium perfringens TaxID=1502 RepID=UPI0039E7956F
MLVKSNFEKFIEGKVDFLRENDLSVLFKEDFKSENSNIIKLYKMPYIDIDKKENTNIIVYFNLNNTPIFMVDDKDVYIDTNLFPQHYTLIENINDYTIYSIPELIKNLRILIDNINIQKSIQYIDYLSEIGENLLFTCNDIKKNKDKKDIIYNLAKKHIIFSKMIDNSKFTSLLNAISSNTLNFRKIGTNHDSKFYRILSDSRNLFSILIQFKNNPKKLIEELELDFDISFKNYHGTNPVYFFIRKIYLIYKNDIENEISKDIHTQKAIYINNLIKSKKCNIIINNKFICNSILNIAFKDNKLCCSFSKDNCEAIFIEEIESIICDGEIIFDNRKFINEMKNLNSI